MKTLQTLKDVLFGQQKQADDINTALAENFSEFLANAGYDVSGSDYQTVVNEVERFVKEAAESKDVDTLAFKCIAGLKSVEVVKSQQPFEVQATNISEESTKVKFRVVPLLGEVDEPEFKEHTVAKSVSQYTRQDSEEFSFYQLACEVRDELLPFATERAREELAGNDFALALTVAKGYYSK